MTNEATVLEEYERAERTDGGYQTEAELESSFIADLQAQGYEYLPIHTEEDLLRNLRAKMSELNEYEFSDDEWSRFLDDYLAKGGEGIVAKAKKVQEDDRYTLTLDDGATRNFRILDKEDVMRNSVQVVNQYVAGKKDGALADNRYDVTILVNGLPLVHVELKKRGIPLREAFNQIERYQRDSFFSGRGLFEYVQIFVISNGTDTKYYSNTTRSNTVAEASRRAQGSGKKTSASFVFTSFWADAQNNVVRDLVDFTRTFFRKRTLLNILVKYCVLTSEDLLLVMRPYQIAAAERVLDRIARARDRGEVGTRDAGGYIWHTTGSGKTLTSFKTARLASDLPYVDKVVFVVDRKDLDYQTCKEYDRFEKGAADGSASTTILAKNLANPDKRILVTTIQKLASFISRGEKRKQAPEVYDQKIVFIFDECHRSQFGKMHEEIVKAFKKYWLFGFTGTPIFPTNAPSGKKLCTTEDAFGKRLHTYTIVNAIDDHNVLPFRVEYVKTMKEKEDLTGELVPAIDSDSALLAPARVTQIVDYILNRFNVKTYRGEKTYKFNRMTNVKEVVKANRKAVESGEVRPQRREETVSGFNSIFAVSSIEAARLYYNEFQKQMKEKPDKALKIATIFSQVQNADPDSDDQKNPGAEPASDCLDEENPNSAEGLNEEQRSFLDAAIADYNAMFDTNYSSAPDSFMSYYKDVAMRMKNKELDLLIVVNMFLTGFDATTLNTLWVDKNLKTHGLIQAFSRTNRILNSVKAFGNIVCFRNLSKEVDDALALFGNKDARGVALLRPFSDYYYGYDEKGMHVDGYVDYVDTLKKEFPLSAPSILGESKQKEFIRTFGAFLRMRNLLMSFDEFDEKKRILSERDVQDYLARYQDLRDEWRRKPHGDGGKTDIEDDVVFEIELVRQIEVNIDYILMLVQKMRESGKNEETIRVTIRSMLNSSGELRPKAELVDKFINKYEGVEVAGMFLEFVKQESQKQFEELVAEEKLNSDQARKFINDCFRNGEVKTTGTDLDAVLPKVSRFGGKRAEIKERAIEKIRGFFERFRGLINAV